ncbi:MAG: serine/threonine-protein kinase, partial [Maioricimonas sp. JB049]
MAEETNETGSVVYCPGCNIRFFIESMHELCPRCGLSVAWEENVSVNEPTQLWRREETETPTVAGGDEEDLRYLVGQTLGVYRCEGLLGRGGMGWVFEAFHADLHRRCALKLMSPRLFVKDRESLARFMNEARAAAALVHPNVVTTHALGKHDGLHFLEMELVRGQSLQHALRSGRLTPLRSGAIALGIASGLAAAHREHILHRDLKPDNVLMTLRGIPKIGDFGLAKRVVSARRSRAPDTLVGTPHYMAPELFSGMPATPASDVYALGICLFRMLTGRLPYTASSLDELIATVTQKPLPDIRREVPEVSLEMAECVNLLLARSPENRPRDGIEAFQLLQSILGQARDLESMVQEALGDAAITDRVRTAKGYEITVQL